MFFWVELHRRSLDEHFAQTKRSDGHYSQLPKYIWHWNKFYLLSQNIWNYIFLTLFWFTKMEFITLGALLLVVLLNFLPVKAVTNQCYLGIGNNLKIMEGPGLICKYKVILIINGHYRELNTNCIQNFY